MSDYAYVADRARKAFSSVARLESAVARSPGDRSLQVNLASMRKLAQQAQEELERLARVNQIEICEYRIVPEGASSYGVAEVSRSLLEYQNLFSQIYDAFRNGKKSNAVIGKEAAHESALDFAYSYSGSLGVVLLAQSERDFFEGKLDKPIEALYQIMDIGDVDNVKDIAHTLGRAVVKRIHDWSQANAEGGFAADVKWKRSDGRLLGQMVDRQRMANIAGLIEASSDESTSQITVSGMLVGASLHNRSFHIAVPDGDSYRGHFSVDLKLPSELRVGRFYEAKIDVSETYNYATEQEKRTNTLVSLKGPTQESQKP